MAGKKRYEKFGQTRLGETIYKEVNSKLLLIEKDLDRLVLATPEELARADFEEGVGSDEESV